MCYFAAGNGEAEVKDNNKKCGRGQEMEEGEWERREKARRRQSEWQATVRGCLSSGRSDPLTFTEWPIAPCRPLLEKFKRTQIHRGNAMPCGLTHSLTFLCRAPPPSSRVMAVTLLLCVSCVSHTWLNVSNNKEKICSLTVSKTRVCVFVCVPGCPGPACSSWQTDR